MAIKYINFFQSEALNFFHKLGILFWKQTIWQPCLGVEVNFAKEGFRFQMCPSFSPYLAKGAIKIELRMAFVYSLWTMIYECRYVGKPLCLVSFLVFNIAAFYLTLSQHNFGNSKICSSPTCCLENFAAITQSKKQCHVHTCMYACHLKKMH
jgi:hypothetical protein